MISMKKFMAISVVLSMLCMLAAGCSGGVEAREPANVGSTTGTESLPGASSDASDDTETPTVASTGDETATEAAGETFADVQVDVDFTLLSDIMARAELNNLLTNSNQYIGKTIKVSGSYYSLYLPETSQEYHFISFAYADACCRSGLEFRMAENSTPLEKYPEQNKDIIVIGTVGKYEEWGSTYAYLAVDRLAVI